ncbi:aldehyde dehydrogenase family protein [Brevibacterium pigmentatum]|uniref:aldehyde dehydrogenase family protein n=1 Tax=Brevibacterium pigmentatum TaxID=1496080 RepID=UPI00141E4EC8|nr:aldehyde dehydrogenase family protein [Brevibacterium pigmentatum]
MSSFDRFYINGDWVPAGSAHERLPVLNPTTEEAIAEVALASKDDIDRAVDAAQRALPSWSSTEPKKRAQYLHAIADAIEQNVDGIAAVLTEDVGVPTKFAQDVQVGWTIQYFRDAANALSDIEFESAYGDSAIVRREPVGVVAAITPWNFPLMQSAAKVAPALAAGCTVVLKPSEVAPLSLFSLAEIASEVGLPAGVLNIATGYGPEIGEHLVCHPGVNAVSFTGSTRAGTRIAALAAADVKRVTLELGGKSAGVVLPGADIEQAARATLLDCYLNSGQKCVAQTRLLVPRSQLEAAESTTKAVAQKLTVGDPADPSVDVGPVVSAAQLARVRDHIIRAEESGAQLIVGGADSPANLGRGYFVRPTVFSSVTTDMPLAQEEVFGPVLAILPYDTVDEAIEIANDSEYGLGGGVWAKTRDEGIAIARKIRTGQVAINGAIPTPDLPFGGFKKSGYGREGGAYAVNEFLEIKTIY